MRVITDLSERVYRALPNAPEVLSGVDLKALLNSVERHIIHVRTNLLALSTLTRYGN